jgi:cutinase
LLSKCDKITWVKPYPVISLLCAAGASTLTLVIAPVPSVSAEPCPDVEVVFARGTDEPPGLGEVGESFVDTLRAQVGAKSLGMYAVNYPASMDFPRAVDGITDAGTHVQQMAAACPKTQMILGGYSQGAAVMGFVTDSQVPDGARLAQQLQPMSPEVADHVAAVTLFGTPSNQFMNFINQPAVTVGPLYAAKTIQLCAPNDPICGGSGDFAAHKRYEQAGMIDQAAVFTASRLVEPPPANGPSPSPGPSRSPAPLASPSPGPTHSPAPTVSPSPGPTRSPAPVAAPGPAASPSPTASPSAVASHMPGPPPGPPA